MLVQRRNSFSFDGLVIPSGNQKHRSAWRRSVICDSGDLIPCKTWLSYTASCEIILNFANTELNWKTKKVCIYLYLLSFRLVESHSVCWKRVRMFIRKEKKVRGVRRVGRVSLFRWRGLKMHAPAHCRKRCRISVSQPPFRGPVSPSRPEVCRPLCYFAPRFRVSISILPRYLMPTTFHEQQVFNKPEFPNFHPSSFPLYFLTFLFFVFSLSFVAKVQINLHSLYHESKLLDFNNDRSCQTNDWQKHVIHWEKNSIIELQSAQISKKRRKKRGNLQNSTVKSSRASKICHFSSCSFCLFQLLNCILFIASFFHHWMQFHFVHEVRRIWEAIHA